jgi:MFS family permease
VERPTPAASAADLTRCVDSKAARNRPDQSGLGSARARPAVLVAARFVQGIGGAMTAAVTLGMIVTMFPEPREQAKAIGVYGFVASGGGTIGLLVGGGLTQAID